MQRLAESGVTDTATPRNSRITSMFVVACGESSRYESAAGERHRHQELVGEVLADRRLRREVRARLLDAPLGDRLRADARLAEAGEDLGDVLALDLERTRRCRARPR